MTSRKLGFGLLLGVLALLLVAGLTIATNTNQSSPAAAAPAAQATATTTTPAATKPPETKPTDTKPAGKLDEAQKYLDAFSKDWAARLGVSEDKLNSTFSAAIASTLDQMVKDGKISQAEADKLKTATKDGFKSFLNLPNLGNIKGGDFSGIDNKVIAGVLQDTLDKVAQVLNLTPSALQDKLKAGQSLTTIAQEQKVDIQKVKDSLTASVKTELEKLVKDGKLTQTQADAINQQAPLIIEKLINSGFIGKGGK